MKSRQASAGSISTRAFAAAPRGRWTASPGRSSAFDGIQAQYEHSPPKSSRFDDGDPEFTFGERSGTLLTRAPPPTTMTLSSTLRLLISNLLIPLHPVFIGSS